MAAGGALSYPSVLETAANSKSDSGADLCVILEDLVNLAHPVHVQIFGEIRPSVMPRFSDESTMLSRHTQILKVPKVMF